MAYIRHLDYSEGFFGKRTRRWLLRSDVKKALYELADMVGEVDNRPFTPSQVQQILRSAGDTLGNA